MFRFLEQKKRLLVYTPLIIYWLILLAATSFPTNALPTVAISDKFMHLFAYLGLGILLNLALIFQDKYPALKSKNRFYTIFIGSIYGLLDEVHQYFIPGRYFELLDLLADFIGLVLAVVIIIFLLKIFKYIPGEKKLT